MPEIDSTSHVRHLDAMMQDSFLRRNIVGIHYTVRIGIGVVVLWFLTQAMHAPSSLWAIISLIIVTEPQMRLAWLAFQKRMINTVMGAAVGFAVLVYFGPNPTAFLAAITFTALLSTYINKVQQGWRIAPITTALVISAGMQQTVADGMHYAMLRTFEVFLGSAMAVIVTMVMSRIWQPAEPAGEAEMK